MSETSNTTAFFYFTFNLFRSGWMMQSKTNYDLTKNIDTSYVLG